MWSSGFGCSDRYKTPDDCSVATFALSISDRSSLDVVWEENPSALSVMGLTADDVASELPAETGEVASGEDASMKGIPTARKL